MIGQSMSKGPRTTVAGQFKVSSRRTMFIDADGDSTVEIANQYI